MSIICFYYHIVICTKYRKMTINDLHKHDLYRYLNGVMKKSDAHVLAMNGTANHIHILIKCERSVDISALVRNIKLAAHHFMRKMHPQWFPTFTEWSPEYAAFSCSTHNRDRIINYISNQERHHYGRTLEDELKAIYQRAGIDPTRIAHDKMLEDEQSTQ